MKKMIIVLLTLALITTPLSMATASSPQRLIVPAYYDSSGIWSTTFTNLTPGDIAIINPDDGCGTAKSTMYVSIVTNASARGIITPGYVFTGYGKRAAATVKAQVDNYFNWYGETSIFFDEVATGAAYLPYYTDLYNYVKARGGTVILNPGTIPDEGYMKISDLIIVFEDRYSSYAAAQFPAWLMKYSPTKLANLVLSCPTAAMASTVALSAQRNAGYIYITDDTLPNPWDSMASYITQEKALLSGGIISTPAPTASPTLTPTVEPPTIAPTATPPPTTDYRALYNAEIVTNASLMAQITSLQQAMVVFKAGLKGYIDTH